MATRRKAAGDNPGAKAAPAVAPTDCGIPTPGACPFCSNPARLEPLPFGTTLVPLYVVKCWGCPAMMVGMSPEGLVVMWNSRPE